MDMSLLQRFFYRFEKKVLELTANFFGYFYFEALRIRGELVTRQVRLETQNVLPDTDHSLSEEARQR